MPIELFGFQLGRKQEKKEEPVSFVPKDHDDGAVTLEAGGFFGHYMDLDGRVKNDIQLIQKYREMSLHPECELAVDDIVNESIINDDNKQPVQINVDDINYSSSIKKRISEEFDEILSFLNFKKKGYEIFRHWYIDSRLYYHIILDTDSKKGIKEVRRIDPTHIRKVRELKKKDRVTGEQPITIIKETDEFYIYNDKDVKFASTPQADLRGLKISPDAINYIHSGLFDSAGKRVIGYLHKAIKPLNQLRMIEDAVVIYRISRAPERRIFYIDVGSLPKNKAEQYLRDIMNRYKNKLVYDANTGEIRDDKKHMSMLEDYWLPRRDGGRGTEISTLDGGQNLGEMEDVEYFKKKLYRSLNVPVTRLEADNGFNMGRASEINRDELKFNKFIRKLQSQFAELFNNFLRVQLITKGIIKEDEWDSMVQSIAYDFVADSVFAESKEIEKLKERMEILRDIGEYEGKFYSTKWIQKNILRMTDEDIEQEQTQIEQEKAERAEAGEDEGDDLDF
tara:strand:+ start:3332 stop:4852 length:1521 start_codon:yes stop_codon:yes gene_type:complete